MPRYEVEAEVEVSVDVSGEYAVEVTYNGKELYEDSGYVEQIIPLEDYFRINATIEVEAENEEEARRTAENELKNGLSVYAEVYGQELYGEVEDVYIIGVREID